MMSSKRKTPKALKRMKRWKKPLIPKRKLFRANEPLLSVFMWGVNHTVNELTHVVPPTLLLPDDFKAYSKIKIDNNAFNKDNMPSHFKIKEYCPHVFRNLRERFGIDEADYLFSMVHDQPKNESKRSNKSSSRLYISFDGQFLIKELCAEEIAEIHSILKPYHEYVVEKHGKTLLPQYLGMYRLTVDGAETYLLVMRNIFGHKYPIHKKFDLKGSTVQRQASEKEKSKELPTFKDNDFLEDGSKLYLTETAKSSLIHMLTADTEFLSKLHLMDYSLLVGIHDVDKAAQDKADSGQTGAAAVARDSTGDDEDDEEDTDDDLMQPATPPDSPQPSNGAFSPFDDQQSLKLDDEFYATSSAQNAPVKEVYFIGLVDILTYYGVKKRTAQAAKSVKYGNEAENISTVKPKEYARRLVEFISKIVMVVEEGGPGGSSDPEQVPPPVSHLRLSDDATD